MIILEKTANKKKWLSGDDNIGVFAVHLPSA